MSEAAQTISHELQAQIDLVGEKIVEQLRTVFDPEIPVNIYDLGLIYNIDLKPAANEKLDASIKMTLTTPNCPVAEQMPAMVKNAAANVAELGDIDIHLTFDPPWTRDMMSDEARLHLNMF
jgi:FeS assembly SUF system protein